MQTVVNYYHGLGIKMFFIEVRQNAIIYCLLFEKD